MDAAENDHVGVGSRCLLGETERIADEIGDVLHLGELVVVSEDDRVALAAETVDSLREAGVDCGLLNGTDGEHRALSWRFRSD
jgi:hypothetical protein